MPDCTKAIKLDPKMTFAYTNRGIAFRIQKKPDLTAALADFNKAIELSPAYAVAIAGRGEVYRLQGKLDRAVADFNKALTLSPNDGFTLAHLGYALFAKGDASGAIVNHEPLPTDVSQRRGGVDAPRSGGIAARAVGRCTKGF